MTYLKSKEIIEHTHRTNRVCGLWACQWRPGQGESHDGYNGGSSKNEYSGKFGEKHVLNNSLWGTEYQSEEVEMQVNDFDFYKLQLTTSNHVSQIGPGPGCIATPMIATYNSRVHRNAIMAVKVSFISSNPI